MGSNIRHYGHAHTAPIPAPLRIKGPGHHRRPPSPLLRSLFASNRSVQRPSLPPSTPCSKLATGGTSSLSKLKPSATAFPLPWLVPTSGRICLFPSVPHPPPPPSNGVGAYLVVDDHLKSPSTSSTATPTTLHYPIVTAPPQ
jgi:hypothetical protein